MYSPAASLTDPPMNSPIAGGALWVQSVALGTTATIVAIIAVAAVGLLMLTGRLDLRRGITTVIGCFVLFGASTIAANLTSHNVVGMAEGRGSNSDQGKLASSLQSPQPTPSAYDPYAGASVPAAR